MSEPLVVTETVEWEGLKPTASSHIFYHHEPVKPTVSVKLERNSRSLNWEVSVSNAGSVEEALELLDKARKEMEFKFGSVQVVP